MRRNLQRGNAGHHGSAAVQMSVAQMCGGCGLTIAGCACGVPQGGGGNFTAQGVTQPPPSSGVPYVANGRWPGRCADGCYPRGMRDGVIPANLMGELQSRPAPYQDPAFDFANMDVLYSDIITIAPGVTTDIDVSPSSGTFTMAYYRIVAVDETTQDEVVDWRHEQPAVVGCPSPCNVNGPILAQLSQAVPDQCAGKPLLAFLDRDSENVPLRTAVTNNQAAGNILVQVEVRGYCCSTRVCL